MEVIFEKGLLGIEEIKNYKIEDIEENEDFKLLTAIGNEEISIIIISPFLVKSDYEIELSDEVSNRLKIESKDEVELFTTVTVNSDIKKITTNLRAPIVINKRNKLAEQIVLNKEQYKIKYPLIKE